MLLQYYGSSVQNKSQNLNIFALQILHKCHRPNLNVL